MPERSPQFLSERRFGVNGVIIRQRYEIVERLKIDFPYEPNPSCNEIFILAFHIQRNVVFGRFAIFEERSHTFRYKAFSCRLRQFQALGIELVKDLRFRRLNRFTGFDDASFSSVVFCGFCASSTKSSSVICVSVSTGGLSVFLRRS